MGCSGAKQTVESTVDEIAADPTKGLPNLQTAIKQSAKEGSSESIKNNVPRILEVLSTAIGQLSEETPRPILAACAVIVSCVKLYNATGVSGAQPNLDGNHVKQCQNQLGLLLKKVQAQASRTYFKEFICYCYCCKPWVIECYDSSEEAKAIAMASKSLFHLEMHCADCKTELVKSGGTQSAVLGLKSDSGLKIDAKDALANMLSSFVDQNCNEVDSIMANGGIKILIEYVQDKATPKSSKPYVASVLKACLAHGKNIASQDIALMQEFLDQKQV